MSNNLYKPYSFKGLALQNRIVMAPMTRNRASATNVPSALQAEYYGQRSSGGLLITEGTSPSANGVGYPRIPAIYTEEQALAWKAVTAAAHEGGAKIFLQIMHTGRVGHQDNLPANAVILAPSAIAVEGQIYTDKAGMQNYPVPQEMTDAEIKAAIQEYVSAAKHAIEVSGFDGVELHAANGYLLEQFLNPHANQRTDGYGGSAENRNRFTIEVAEAVITTIGADKVGIRISPDGAFNSCTPFEGSVEQYSLLITKLNELGLAYLHLVNHEAMGAPKVNPAFLAFAKENFHQTIILSGGFDAETAENAVENTENIIAAFGRPYLANPDLPYRLENRLPLNQPDYNTFYLPGEKGYTDYPVYAEVEAK